MTITADELLARNSPAHVGSRVTKTQQAEVFIREELANGPIPSAELEAKALAAGIKSRTYDIARANIGLDAKKDGMTGQWISSLPESPPTASGVQAEHVEHYLSDDMKVEDLPF